MLLRDRKDDDLQARQLAVAWPQLLYQDHFALPFQRRLAFCAHVMHRSAREVALVAPAALVAPLSQMAARVLTCLIAQMHAQYRHLASQTL